LAVFGKPRYLGLVDIGDPVPKAGQWIVIKTIRGLEMGLLGGSLSQEQEVKYRKACIDEPSDEHTRGPEPMLQEVDFVDPASDVQIEEHYLRRFDEERVLIRSRQILCDHQLPMKLVDVEYIMDRKKLFFYFTSEQRVDFRAYVRDLAKEFRIRIEMRQIGVRDEAKTVRGIAPCGKPCCCSYWLHHFTPINIRMVKEQNLALNPTKISGICGRLMCCMCYEHSNYSELWQSLPNPGSKIKTALGTYVLEGVDLRTQSVRIRFPEGREVSIAVSEFENFKDTVSRGETWEVEPPKDAPRRSVLTLRPSLSPRMAAASKLFVSKIPCSAPVEPKVENPKDFVKNNKKLRPEKITLEEHIAGRVGDMKRNSASAINVALTAALDAEVVKRRPMKHKGAYVAPSPVRDAVQGKPAAKDAKRIVGPKAKPAPPRKDGAHPLETRPFETRPAETRPRGSFDTARKDLRKDARDHRDNRGRSQPFRHGGGENRGREGQYDKQNDEKRDGEKRGDAGNGES
jgi:cell fate regulator YaaT (PSP1 superfamily)